MNIIIEKQLVCELIGYIRKLGVNGVLGEVTTPAGRIDVLTPKLIIEAKAIRSWKAGIGQLVSYGAYFPDRKLVLFTFGKIGSQSRTSRTHDFGRKVTRDKTKRRIIKDTCLQHGIVQFHHTGDFDDFREFLIKN